ncbi:MAG TPA: glutamate--tRNA ligase [Acidimicrobiales bacterium]|nr:glutamate--tRNA ligase [Acidimicrobiales bacterium]
MTAPRVRFAPSPTGFLHVGSARAALFNWLFARHTGGTLVLRIEDTDPARSRDDLIEGIERALRWLGLDWDEGPVRQSGRMHLYREAADKLLAAGVAYYCNCTPEALRERARKTPGYDGFCRDRALQAGAVRLRTPDEGETIVQDLIRGEVRFENGALEDFVVLRTDGSPTFVLANAVDDTDMAISHVIRGEDLLPSTPKGILARRLLGETDDPVFAHLPLLVDESRQKLSKRRHSVAVEEFREQGYLAEAMRNYLALLGWAPSDDREVVSIDEIIAEFRLEDVKPSPAFFDEKKLGHINAEYIRALPGERFISDALPWLEEDPPWPPERFDLGTFTAVAPLVQERVRTLSEVPAMVDFLFLEEPDLDKEEWDKMVGRVPPAAALLDDATAEYASCDWSSEVLHGATLAIGERHGLKLNKAQAPIRLAVTGRSVGPPLFESLVVLGRECVVRRLSAARQRLP